MGKGTIIAHLGAGQYTVTVNQERARIIAAISALTARIAALDTKLSGMADGAEKSWTRLQRAALVQRRTILQQHTTDPTVTAWCADLTGDLSGVVGTIEVPGERGTVQIRPGYMGAATYSAARDGQLQEVIASTPAGAFFNMCLLPGWQKYKPTARWGVLSDLNVDTHTCTVTLEAATSSAQGLNINQGTVLSDVPIEYMSCNGAAFSNGDNVLVEFNNQDFTDPVVIGFKDNPKPCETGEYVIISTSCFISPNRWTYVTVWNVVSGGVAAISGLTFPCSAADPVFVEWESNCVDVSNDLFSAPTLQGCQVDCTLAFLNCDSDPPPGEYKSCECSVESQYPDPCNTDRNAALPFIHPDGSTVYNSAWHKERQYNAIGWMTGYEGEHYVKNPCFYAFDVTYGTRLPISKRFSILNNLEPEKTAINIQREDYYHSRTYMPGESSFSYSERTFTTITPIGELDAVTVRDEYADFNEEWSEFLKFAGEELNYSGPAYTALYSTKTLVQMFALSRYVKYRTFERAAGGNPWVENESTFSEPELIIIASCRACDGENTDPRTESNNPSFVTAIEALKAYADSQGHGDSSAINFTIVQYFGA